MKARAMLVLAIATTAVFAAAPAHVQAQVGGQGRLGIEAYGGWSLHAMSDLNDSLGSLNRQIGTNLDPIHSGPAWGLGIRIWPHPDLLLRAGFESLMARSEDSEVRFDMGTHVYTVSATYFIPMGERIRYGFGLGASKYYPFGEIRSPGASLPTKGVGLGGRVTAEAIVPMIGSGSLNGVLGYRWGGADNLRFGVAASDIDTDYSGVFLRIGIAADTQPRPEAQAP